MKFSTLFVLALTFLSLWRCASDVDDVEVNGVVLDSKTDIPVSNAMIEVECWYYGNSPDESYEGSVIKSIKTNKDGTYQLTFSKGAFLSFTIHADGYADHDFGEYINSNRINLITKLN